MNEDKLDTTQRVECSSVVAELAAAGFDDAHEIGRGGFGIVFRCWQVDLERDVALKVLMGSLTPDGLERFLREQRAMGRLSGHPNIVGIWSAGTTVSGWPYIVMPYFARDSLEASIGKVGFLKWDKAISVGVRIAGALETAHLRGILHRDVKPANILLTDYGEPQLADFGIACVEKGFDMDPGAVTGSPAYIAPEVLSGGQSNPSSDIYSLATTLFCALTGHAPFERQEGEAIASQLSRIATRPTPSLRGRSEIPVDVAAAIDGAIARDPADRPTTAESFGDRLRAVQLRHNCRVDDMILLKDRIVADESGGTSFAPSEPSSFARIIDGKASASRMNILIPSGPQNPAGSIPLELTSFVGRRRELVSAKNGLSSSRLVTLTGAGGVGKTRLALHLAHSMNQSFGDGVWLIELGEVHDEIMVAGIVAANLGILDQASTPSFSRIAGYLFDKDILLIFDNCEHLLGTIASMADLLLHSCPKLKILATSREQLGVTGETLVRVPPMSAPDSSGTLSSRKLPRYESVALFVDRAAVAVPGFELDDENQNAVAQICRRLDGLPLAIELAVGRLRAMSVEQILDRLDNRYRLLTQGSRVAPSRQQTLQVCVDWSYNLCTSSEQVTWAQVTVFAGSFDLDAAEAICRVADSGIALIDTLAQLVDKSILIREQSGRVVRYRLLDTLREYGWEKVQASGEGPDLRRRHCDWYEKLAMRADAEWISANQREWISRLLRERPNLHEVLLFCLTEQEEAPVGLRIAAALFPFWECHGLLNEGRLWFDRLLASECSFPATDFAKALCASSILAGLQGHIPVADALLADALEAAGRVEDQSLTALAAHAAGCIALYRGDPTTAVARSNDALQTASESGYLYCQVGALTVLGVAYLMLGDTDEATRCYRKLLEVTDNGEFVYRGRSSMSGGWALWKRGESEKAKEILQNGLRLSSHIDDPVGVTRCMTVLAWIEADPHNVKRTALLQNAKRATVLLGVTASLYREIGGPSVGFLERLADHKMCVQHARTTLGDAEFRAQLELGKKLNFHDAVVYALGESSQVETARSSGELSLTRREREVAELVGEGLTNKAIAARLVISQRTVQGHVEHILTKLDFTSRTQIAVWIKL